MAEGANEGSAAMLGSLCLDDEACFRNLCIFYAKGWLLTHHAIAMLPAQTFDRWFLPHAQYVSPVAWPCTLPYTAMAWLDFVMGVVL